MLKSIIKLYISRLTIKTLPQAIRSIKIVVGFTLLMTGIALIVLPGPAIVVIPIALAILGTEFVWAKRLLRKFRENMASLKENKKGRALC